MTKEQLFSLIRHILSALGGILVAKGLADDQLVLAGVAAAVAIASIIWSIKDKTFELGSLEGAIRQVVTAIAGYFIFKGNQAGAAQVEFWGGIVVAVLVIVLGQTDKLWRNATPQGYAQAKRSSSSK